jgi:hypothetical protein
MTLFLHLGAYKTATTFIQYNLIANRDWLEDEGWRFVYLRKDWPEVYRALVKLRHGEDEAAAAKLSGFLNTVSTRKKSSIISSEAMLGPMSMMATGEIYAGYARMIARLREGVSGDVRIGFCVREYASYIESTYNWLVSEGRTDSFADYVANLRLARVSWVNVAEALVDAFGAGNVHFWTYEDFKLSPKAHIAKLLNVAGVAPRGRLKLPQTKPRNVSYSPDGLVAAMALNQSIAARGDTIDKKEAAQLRQDLRKNLAQTMPAVENNRSSLLVTGMRAALTQKYEDDLAEMRRRFPESWARMTVTPGA